MADSPIEKAHNILGRRMKQARDIHRSQKPPPPPTTPELDEDGDPVPSITEVVRAIEVACTGVQFPGGPDPSGLGSTPVKVSVDVASHTLANARRISLAYRLLPQNQPTQVTLDDTLVAWKLDGLATAIKPLKDLVIYKFVGGLRTTYLFAGSYGAGYLVCVCGSAPPG